MNVFTTLEFHKKIKPVKIFKKKCSLGLLALHKAEKQPSLTICLIFLSPHDV